MLPVSDLPESDDCTGCCAYKCVQSQNYPRMSTVKAAVPTNASSLRLTRECRRYRLLCLQMLPVSDLPESDDCTGCCAYKCFQSQTYPRVATVQAAVPTNASSLRLT
ncbi:hypothetical protein DPMN_192218 [Dreissena polymorpha]|uniref:Uncharacterized protein n=1 Tax=Dreissena polymorpha TaxID=45954 RepID=A0A9D3Y118_DREPO|nr:hypothetical protein DPMN_192218 [Dreissena polymorpha]